MFIFTTPRTITRFSWMANFDSYVNWQHLNILAVSIASKRLGKHGILFQFFPVVVSLTETYTLSFLETPFYVYPCLFSDKRFGQYPCINHFLQ